MRVIITGGAGFLGARLADHLLSAESPLRVTELVLADRALAAASEDPRVRTVSLDLTEAGAAGRLLSPGGPGAGAAVVFHLAAVVSGQAEADFDLGLAVNLDGTRALLEAVRRHATGARVVLASTVGVFGGELPAAVDERVAPTPQTSYGAAKAAAELLVNEYSRRGFVDGCVLRLPTVTVRAGAANAAVTSFASAVVREPLAGRAATVPVPAAQRLWVCSPRAVVRNMARAATLPAAALGAWRVLHLPGLCVSAAEMVAALREVAGDEVAARVLFDKDDEIARMVASFPERFDDARALRLGFETDATFADVIRSYIREELSDKIVKDPSTD